MVHEEKKSTWGCPVALVLFILPWVIMPMLPEGSPVGPFLGIGWLMISIPVAIVASLDWFRSSPKTSIGRVLRNLVRLPVFLLGLTAILIGASSIVWVAYNLFWERQPEFQEGISLPWGLATMVLIILFGVRLVFLSFQTSAEQRTDTDQEVVDHGGAQEGPHA